MRHRIVTVQSSFQVHHGLRTDVHIKLPLFSFFLTLSSPTLVSTIKFEMTGAQSQYSKELGEATTLFLEDVYDVRGPSRNKLYRDSMWEAYVSHLWKLYREPARVKEALAPLTTDEDPYVREKSKNVYDSIHFHDDAELRKVEEKVRSLLEELDEQPDQLDTRGLEDVDLEKTLEGDANSG
ncbi:uncharacterized protein [Branchiostoma lanceolatum]|uniref:uncharacterized protein n=1 Tax=Branchiostoma lanceolatum TaxID=7740 RepID=UPI00345259E0